MSIATVKRVGPGDWQVWLPHACAPTEPDDPDIAQIAWGTFYFPSWREAIDFTLQRTTGATA